MRATMTEADEIARFIAERGVTRCPAAYAAPSTAVISEAEMRVHLERGDVTFNGGWKAQKDAKLTAHKAHMQRLHGALLQNGGYTPERIEVLRVHRLAGTPMRTIRAMMQQLPGGPVASVKMLSQFCWRRGWKTPRKGEGAS